jgi:hypothetical protein
MSTEKHNQMPTATAGCAAAAGYAVALEALAKMSREEGMLSMQAGLADDPLARLTHKQHEVALAYAHLRLKRHDQHQATASK